MNLLEFAERAAEDHAEWVSQIMHSTEERGCECPICTSVFGEGDSRWRLPHVAAMNMEADEAYVCSGDCAAEWCERNWEVIEEYEEKERTNG